MKTERKLIQICLLCAVLLQAVSGGAQPVTKIATGSEYSLFLKSNGSLWAMGNNSSGQLGDGTYNQTNLPEQIVVSNVTAIAAGYYHSLFLKGNGSLWAMGSNNKWQLGDGTHFDRTNHPEQIVVSNVTAIAGGSFHSLFLKSDGSLWAMGDNQYGELGDGTTDNGFAATNLPEQIVASNVTAIAAGFSHSLFLKSNGSLWAMGNNSSGQLGDGSYNNTNLPEQIVASNVTAIAAGTYFSLFLKSNGSLWAMGDNSAGQLGDGTDNQTNLPEQIVASNVTAIAAGNYHSLFLKSNGSLWAMGANYNGELGDGTYGNYLSSGTNHPKQIVAGNVVAIAAGWNDSLFLKRDGSLWAMGDNQYGELGDGTYGTGTSPNYGTNQPEQILAAYNQISSQRLSNNMQFSFVGIAGTNYALDRSFGLSPPNWMPQASNPANSFGALVFTNTPDPTTNNFWRIRYVP